MYPEKINSARAIKTDTGINKDSIFEINVARNAPLNCGGSCTPLFALTGLTDIKNT